MKTRSPLTYRLLLASSVLLATLALGQDIQASSDPSLGSDPSAELSRPSPNTTSRPLTFRGAVFAPDGNPAEGAVVVTSAGGRAVTDVHGDFVLRADVPRDASTLQLTAVGRNQANLIASRKLELRSGSSLLTVGVLQLTAANTCTPAWLPTFGGTPGVNDRVWAVAVFDDGNGAALYAAGQFSLAGGTPVNNVAKWDGSRWSALGSGVDSIAYSMCVFDDGSGPALYVGGQFDNAGGSVAGSIARWNGSSWSDVGGGMVQFGDRVYGMAVHDDGSGPALYATGDFILAGGVLVRHVAKWDGATWSGLGGGLDIGGGFALAEYDAGSGPELYLGGTFSTAGGVAVHNVAKWDGSSWAALGQGTDAIVRDLAVFDDGHGPALYAGGEFSTAGGRPAATVAKWDGSEWSNLGRGVRGGRFGQPQVGALSVYDDGQGAALYAGGDFTIAGGQVVTHLAKWDGSIWSGVGTLVPASPITGIGMPVLGLTVFDDGNGPELVLGGAFFSANGLPVNRVASWNGERFAPLASGANGLNGGAASGSFFSVSALTTFEDDGETALYAGGSFTFAGGQPANRIAKWDGSSWSSLGTGFDNPVAALAVFDDGKGPQLFAGGSFTAAGGVSAKNIARWDGTRWRALRGAVGSVFATIHAMTVFDDGSGPALYVVGNFTTAPGTNARNIAKWDGTRWSPLGAGINGQVFSLTVFDSGSGSELYAGGLFTSAGGSPAANLARWDGTSWSQVGGGTAGPTALVSALTVFDDGTGPALYAGGNFVIAGGVSARHVARWDGSSWSALGEGTNDWVRSLAVFDDGRGPALYAGGQFTTAGGMAAEGMARWDGSSWSPLGSGVNVGNGSNPRVESLAVFEDADGPALYAGGSFVNVPDSGDAHLAKWGSVPSSPLPTSERSARCCPSLALAGRHASLLRAQQVAEELACTSGHSPDR